MLQINVCQSSLSPQRISRVPTLTGFISPRCRKHSISQSKTCHDKINTVEKYDRLPSFKQLLAVISKPEREVSSTLQFCNEIGKSIMDAELRLASLGDRLSQMESQMEVMEDTIVTIHDQHHQHQSNSDSLQCIAKYVNQTRSENKFTPSSRRKCRIWTPPKKLKKVKQE